jgi:hypothetical protein
MYVFSNVAEQDVEYLVFKLIHKVFVPFSFVCGQLNMYLKFFLYVCMIGYIGYDHFQGCGTWCVAY